MKTASRASSRYASSRRGSALLFVLFSVILITLLVVGLLMRAGSENRSSSYYMANADARQLSDMAINLVQAQIDHATSQSSTLSWASQPGAIRLFNSDGSLSLIYKLYSSDLLTTTSASALLADDIPAANWSSQPATWTDINAPATLTQPDGTSRMFFPVLDPRNPSNLASTVNIEGFSLTIPPGWSTATTQPAPMPVRWLYVLQDGTMVSPIAGTTSRIVTVTGASKTNPIVGRIAFWTDDETCKININTASDGTFWDTPHFNTTDEQNRAMYQPAQGEYQSYPGHPATTTLQKVYAGLNPPSSLTSNQLFALSPRYTFGGSEGGTQAATAPIPKKTNRLYSSVGELLFDPTRALNDGGVLNSQQLETSRFFLTAHSSAPEVTLFGTPRIAIWPIHQTNDTAHRSAIDQLIAFCSTINGLPYYFTRSDPLSRTTDISIPRNQTLLNYLDHFTSIAVPGFSSNPFNSKYGPSGNRQILTEIYDYIRMTNLNDPTVTSPYLSASSNFSKGGGVGSVTPSYDSGWNTRGLGRFPVISEAAMLFIGMGQGASGTAAAVPIDSRQTPGAIVGVTGLTPPANTTAVQGFFLMNFFDPAHGFSMFAPGFTVVVQGLDQYTLNGVNMGIPHTLTQSITNYNIMGLLNSSRPFSGIVDYRVLVSFEGLGSGNPATRNPFYSSILPITGTTMSLGGGPLTISVYAGNQALPANLVQTYTIAYPATTSVPVPLVDQSSTAMRLFGSTAAGNYAGPAVDRVDTVQSSSIWGNALINRTYDTIVSMVPTAAWSDYRLFSIVPGPVGSPSSSVPQSAFTLNPAAAPTQRIAFGFRQIAGGLLPGATGGTLTTGLSGVVPSTFNGATLVVPPDWDDGIGVYPPGPYINKADEGTSLGVGTATSPYFGNLSSGAEATSPTFFSANRQVPSPVMFGSLPTGVENTPPTPWQTLLFRPGPNGHPGAVSPADHLLLDLFWMPVAEPYAVSEPFATMGKINMNYQILPFTYITRDTALRSALAPERVAMVDITLITNPARLSLNLSDGVTDSDTGGTLRQFQAKFAGGDIFKSASEICTIFLVPTGQSWTSDAAATAAWYGPSFAGVGDNVRERPYADLYPRLTTKSNSFKIYYTAQALQNPTSNPAAQWNEDSGVILGEQRGSSTLERDIDPTDTNIPDYASNSGAPSLETFYRWRIVESSTFPQ